MSEPSRRLQLRVALKLLTLVAVVAVASVLFGSLRSPDGSSAMPVVSVPLDVLRPGEPRVVDWAGRPILVLHRAGDAAASPLVVYNVGRGAGCPLEFLGDALRDRCDGVRYDLAGRVFPDQPVARNLAVPPHHLRGGELVIGTEG